MRQKLFSARHKDFRIEAPHFCAGAEVSYDVIGWAAPIIAWMRGRHLDWLRRYCPRKGWRLYELPVTGSK